MQTQNRSEQIQVENSFCSTCTAKPPVLFLIFTLLMTMNATTILCGAIMTDHWEYISWNRSSLIRLVNNETETLQWLLDDKVAKLHLKGQPKRDGIFFVPMHGGIWTLCIDLSDQEIRALRRFGYSRKFPCVNYLVNSPQTTRQHIFKDVNTNPGSPTSLHPHLRMQNLSISCALVCLIILGSGGLLGAFSVLQKQLSAMLITGVMYLLAALFALFTLMIIQFKRNQGRTDKEFYSTLDGLVFTIGSELSSQHLIPARTFSTSWSLDLGWGGVFLCATSSFLWILLSKLIRHSSVFAFGV